ncbi:hypothetical protein BO70DRAFT_369855 [Aspergillus heteromorphus CBS 117.55]|uniref:Uncharacterized protein n=1 Tax=Aspergillus heteromorphus CBS 117.55 TaxID=1448321 RepID=A0A317WK20_9EURO|nr:uncharacterized protein BO70DRAFT_369855 [Aspergillus heteromorphus CBS 117.55]PWY86804.1 hypothetical protein BO70DRAFT_369855 [Aspergillus heteromorphus CBS 117.55]
MAHCSLLDVIRQGKFASLTNEAVLQLLGRQFEHDLKGLKNVPSNIEGGAQQALTPSQYLYDHDYSEVNRTLLNILALKWLLADDYAAFTAYQPDPVKLSKATFEKFRHITRSVLDHPDKILALIISLILGDQGKNPVLVDQVTSQEGLRGDEEVNHDEILQKAIAEGGFSESLGLLPPPLKDDVILGVKLGAELNIPQLTQGENVPGSLKGLLMLSGHKQAFDLKYLEIMFDVAGAGGHIDARGATRMIEPVCQSLLLAHPILERVTAGQLSLRDAYDEVLRNRGCILSKKGFKELSTAVPADRAFLRLCAMGRVADLPLAQLFDEAFNSLPDETRDALVNGLNVDGLDDGQAVILYYMPALFAELLRVTKDLSKPGRLEALVYLLSFMARTYKGSSPHKGEKGSIIERDVSPAKDIVVQQGPTALDGYDLPARI